MIISPIIREYTLEWDIYLCPEIKNLEETPYYGRERLWGRSEASVILFFT